MSISSKRRRGNPAGTKLGRAYYGPGIPPSTAIAGMAHATPGLLVVGAAAYAELVIELGGEQAALRSLQALAAEVGKPIGVNVPEEVGATTVFLAPDAGWTRQRLAGYVAGLHGELEASLGAIVGVEALN